MYAGMCLFMEIPVEARRGHTRSPRAFQGRFWKPKSGPLQKQYLVLSAEPSLQNSFIY